MSLSPITFGEPEEPRQNMEPSDMNPDEARRFIVDLMNAMHERMRDIPHSEFEPEGQQVHVSERAKQHYGKDCYLLLSGIQAAMREWDASGEGVQELKDEYGGKFVEGVEIGERLVVYEGRDFTFSHGEEEEEDESKFDITF